MPEDTIRKIMTRLGVDGQDPQTFDSVVHRIQDLRERVQDEHSFREWLISLDELGIEHLEDGYVGTCRRPGEVIRSIFPDFDIDVPDTAIITRAKQTRFEAFMSALAWSGDALLEHARVCRWIVNPASPSFALVVQNDVPLLG